MIIIIIILILEVQEVASHTFSRLHDGIYIELSTYFIINEALQ